MKRSKSFHKNRGFTLIITLLMMVMISVVAVGLMSLSSIALRSSSKEQARRTAEANARLGVMLALGDLQKNLGDDRRVTADASILSSSSSQVAQPRLVGVWESATSALAENPTSTTNSISYNDWKTDRFKSWLVSSGDPTALESRDFAKSAATGSTISLFGLKSDGFDLKASTVSVQKTAGANQSNVAWAVVQEGDKAHISLPGETYQDKNDVLQVPMRPNLALSGLATQPEDGWNARASKVISMKQVSLDPQYAIESAAAPKLGADYTTWSRGVLADVAHGGLKTDLNLAFELDDSKFASSTWDGMDNPFRDGSAEVPLHGQVGAGAPVYTTNTYTTPPVTQRFPVGAAPTFDMLRSYYRSYRHLYESGGVTTAFERPQTNIAWKSSMGSIYPASRGSETSIEPVLDRMMYVLSLWADSTGTPWVVLTPVITLWNPYNVAIESSGYVAYPWMDIPVYVNLRIKTGGAEKASFGTYFSNLMGAGKTGAYEGRQSDPYFYCNITGSGTASTSTPVRLEPGEVRVFVPSDTTPRWFDRKSADASRVWNMKPVQSTDDLKLGGGIGLDLTKGMYAGPSYKMQNGDTAECNFNFQPSNYHYFTTLEDSRRIGNPTVKGSIINEVQLFKGSANVSFDSAQYTHFSGVKPKIVGALETYHRTALQAGQQSDIMQSVNTRQRYINAAVSGTSFLAGPNYNSNMRQGESLAGLGVQVTTDGKRAYYGASNESNQGKDRIVLFDIPREPLLSLASFQNADLADTVFSPSNQFGNSWASPYLPRNSVGQVVKKTVLDGSTISPKGLAIYDHSWLQNEALWDRYFLSSIAPQVKQKSGTGSPAVNDTNQVSETRSTDDMITEWVDDSEANPLRNTHYSFHSGGVEKDEIKSQLKGNGGAKYAASYMLVDGAFNVNSTNEGAWRAVLTSLRGQNFETLDASGNNKNYSSKNTPVPRLSVPSGTAGDQWNGFRELTDSQIQSLAKEIVVEVKARGPFQSLAEFVNRRIERNDLGLKGAVQAAIDRAGLNKSGKLTTFDTSKYPNKDNLPDPDTGTGLAGWVNQADILGPMASIITVRSDTFRIRGYGEVKDASGNILAKATCEAVVQRVPEWVDPIDKPVVVPDKLSSETNKIFGRRFEVVSFRMLSTGELES